MTHPRVSRKCAGAAPPTPVCCCLATLRPTQGVTVLPVCESLHHQAVRGLRPGLAHVTPCTPPTHAHTHMHAHLARGSTAGRCVMSHGACRDAASYEPAGPHGASHVHRPALHRHVPQQGLQGADQIASTVSRRAASHCSCVRGVMCAFLSLKQGGQPCQARRSGTRPLAATNETPRSVGGHHIALRCCAASRSTQHAARLPLRDPGIHCQHEPTQFAPLLAATCLPPRPGRPLAAGGTSWLRVMCAQVGPPCSVVAAVSGETEGGLDGAWGIGGCVQVAVAPLAAETDLVVLPCKQIVSTGSLRLIEDTCLDWGGDI